jgi:hypothetical protein
MKQASDLSSNDTVYSRRSELLSTGRSANAEVMGPLLGHLLFCRVHADRLLRGSRLAGIVGNRDIRPSWERMWR